MSLHTRGNNNNNKKNLYLSTGAQITSTNFDLFCSSSTADKEAAAAEDSRHESKWEEPRTLSLDQAISLQCLLVPKVTQRSQLRASSTFHWSADREWFRLAECEENSAMNPARDRSHKLRGTDSLPDPTETPPLPFLPYRSRPEDTAKGRSRESQAQLQFNSTKPDGERSWVNFALIPPLPFCHTGSSPRSKEPGKGKDCSLPDKSRVPGIRESPGHGFSVISGKLLSANSEATTAVQFERDEETNVSKHTKCCKAQTEGWPNFDLNSPFEENFESIRRYELWGELKGFGSSVQQSGIIWSGSSIQTQV